MIVTPLDINNFALYWAIFGGSTVYFTSNDSGSDWTCRQIFAYVYKRYNYNNTRLKQQDLSSQSLCILAQIQNCIKYTF